MDETQVLGGTVQKAVLHAGWNETLSSNFSLAVDIYRLRSERGILYFVLLIQSFSEFVDAVKAKRTIIFYI